jgi:rod shape-determining protein MreB
MNGGLLLRLSVDMGIDLGTATSLVYIKNRGIVLKEPSVVIIDRDTNEVKAVGEEARQMLGRTPGNVMAVRPLRQGVVSDLEITERMLRYFISKSLGRRILRRPRISICVPSETTQVEKRAVEDAAYQAGARDVSIIEEPVAAAIGAGIDIRKPCGNLIVDIGGGTTDIAVICFSGTVTGSSIKVAGDNFDEAIIRYIKNYHHLLIGEKTAQDIKINIGCAWPRPEMLTMQIRGRNLATGLPKTLVITSDEMLEVLREPSETIANTVKEVLERTPPELVGDIYERGIVMTGGGSLLYGLDQLIEDKIGVNTVIADNPTEVVCIGTGLYIDMINEKKEKKAE